MERLTRRINGRAAVIDGYALDTIKGAQAVVGRLAAYEDTGLDPEEVDQICRAAQTMMFESVSDFVRYAITNFEALQTYRSLGPVEELSALVKARDEGRVVVLPCKVWDTIFVIPSKANFELNKISHPENNRVYEQIISSVNWYHKSRYLVRTCDDFCSVLSSEYGITWFLTRAEAEAALSSQKGGPNETNPV